MISVMFCLYRKPGMTEAEFHGYWRNTHGPMVVARGQVLGIRRYLQHHAVPGTLTRRIGESRGTAEPPDGIAQAFYDSIDAMRAAGRNPQAQAAYAELLADEARFIDLRRSSMTVIDEHVVLG